jgi:hypothetical protein
MSRTWIALVRTAERRLKLLRVRVPTATVSQIHGNSNRIDGGDPLTGTGTT